MSAGVAIQLSTEYGQINISNETIAMIAGSAAMECYGLVGMASRKQFKDGIAELLGRENLTRGVEVNLDNNRLAVYLYIIVSYGTKISEVAHNIQQKVKYVLNDVVGLEVSEVNIVVQGVRVSS
ncbi:Alkaline shock protein 23 [compost metagenome]